MATQEDIAKGMYQAMNWLALQIASGSYQNVNISTDEEGVVQPPTESGEEGIPEDDPDTPDIREDLEARAGGAIYVTNKLDKILLDMFNWFAGTVTDQQAEDRLVLLYGFEQAKANIFAQYWYTVYINSSGTVDLNDAVLDGLFFCKGVSVTTFARYIFENHATAAEVPVLEVLAEQLTQAQLDLWFAEGTAVPSKAYETYSCTKIDSEQVVLNMSTAEVVQVTTAGVWKQNHRYRAICSGTFTDSDNPNVVQDMFWEHNTSTGVKVFRNANAFNSTGVANLTAAEVPFEPSHLYNVIVDKTGTAGTCIVGRDNAPFNLPNTVGTLTIDIEDLGEFAI